MQFNQLIERTAPPPTVALADRVRSLNNRGFKIIGLQTGDPDFGMPALLARSIGEALESGLTHYCDSSGYPALRKAIAQKCASYNNITYDPDAEVLVTNGGIHGLYCTIGSLINPGDEVLIPDPTWPTHLNVTELFGGVVKGVQALPENNFLPSIDDYQKQLTSRSKLLLINFPSNPTGAMPGREYYTQLAEFVLENNLLVVSDEVYEHILFDGQSPLHFASFPGMRDRTITLFSCSKSYAMTGVRLGYITGPAQVIARCKKRSQLSITNVATYVQAGVAEQLNTPGLAEEVETMRKEYERRRNLVDATLSQVQSFSYIRPGGAFYYFLDFRRLGIDSISLSEKLLEDIQVAVVPGEFYGKMGQGFLRMTFAEKEEKIMEGLQRIINWADEQS